MAGNNTRIPPPPVTSEDKTIWNNWYVAVKDAINNLRAGLTWSNLDFTGSNITDIQTRNHNDLTNIQGGSSTERYHLTSTQASAIASFNSTQWTDLTDGGGTTLHTHTHNSSTSLQGGTSGEYYHLTSAQHSGLTGGGTTTLHTHTLHGTGSLDFGTIASNSTAEDTLTVTGAAPTSSVSVGAPAAIEAGLVWSAYVSATNTVTVRVHNMTGGNITPAVATWHARVEAH